MADAIEVHIHPDDFEEVRRYYAERGAVVRLVAAPTRWPRSSEAYDANDRYNEL